MSVFSPVLLQLLPAPYMLITVPLQLALQLEERLTLTVSGLRSHALAGS